MYLSRGLLKKCELNNNKFYYVQPDIKLANVIFADDYLPDEEPDELIGDDEIPF